LALNKGAVTVDEGATTRLAKVAGALTLAAGATSLTTTVGGGGGEGTIAKARAQV